MINHIIFFKHQNERRKERKVLQKEDLGSKVESESKQSDGRCHFR